LVRVVRSNFHTHRTSVSLQAASHSTQRTAQVGHITHQIRIGSGQQPSLLAVAEKFIDSRKVLLQGVVADAFDAEGMSFHAADTPVDHVQTITQNNRLHCCKPCSQSRITMRYVKGAISSSWETYLRATATGRHLPYGITQCYLPPDTGECAPP